MARTVKGTITDASNGNPISGAKVKAWDSDLTSGDDYMGLAYTNNNGQYAIQYASGHWDPAPHSWTVWRPDIYIVVYIMSQGGWVKVGKSSVHDDRPHRYDTEINLSVNMPNPHARTCWGRITYEDDGSAASGVSVSAFDNDLNNPFTQDPDRLIPVDRPRGIMPYITADPEDDFMGSTTTDNNGNYVIPYEGGHWDPALHAWTWWRPDIYIIVNGKAPRTAWWQTLGISPTYEDVRHRDGVRIDLAVKRPIEVQKKVVAIAAIELRLQKMIMKGEITSDEARKQRAREIWELQSPKPPKLPKKR